jgi:peptidoglycan/xylan/chitin deacetylase (PgdA/CDA1 family)
MELAMAGCLYYSGLVRLAHWWIQRSGPTLSILCYHSASGGYLREHLLYLKRHYRILHLEAALEELYQPTQEKHPDKDRRPLLALTSDDGYHDLYTYALPLACELHAPLTVFLIPGYTESGKRFWWQESEYLLLHTSVSETTFAGYTYHLGNVAEKQALGQAIDACLRHATSVSERETLIETIRTELGVPCSAELAEQEKALLPLTWVEVDKMEQSEWFSFGAHTMHHPTLAYLSNPTELQHEVSECRIVLEQQLGHPVYTFAYPIGKEEHFVERDVQAVEAAGYRWAVTAIHGLNTCQTDPYRLQRIVVDVDQHWLMIAAKTSGLWDFLVHLGRMPITFLRNMFK